MLSFHMYDFKMQMKKKNHCQKLTSPFRVPVGVHLYDSWISVLNKQ